jgi:hypothetical protein
VEIRKLVFQDHFLHPEVPFHPMSDNTTSFYFHHIITKAKRPICDTVHRAVYNGKFLIAPMAFDYTQLPFNE